MTLVIKEKIFHSLPKRTQPTLASSAKCPTTSNAKRYEKEEGCPEITQFVTRLNYKDLYTHNIQIDYGRLERPSHFHQKEPKVQKVQMIRDKHIFQGEVDMETKRFTGIAILNNENTIQKQKTEKKKMDKINQETQQIHNNRSLTLHPQSKMRLTEVKAYELLKKQKQVSKKHSSRIIKIMVGGGQAHTRVISYPDNAEYLKLCGLKR